MKKSELVKLIRESVKQVLAESENYHLNSTHDIINFVGAMLGIVPTDEQVNNYLQSVGLTSLDSKQLDAYLDFISVEITGKALPVVQSHLDVPSYSTFLTILKHHAPTKGYELA